MASGRLGTADLAATTLTTLYTVPATKLASFTLAFANRTGAAITARVALAAAAAPVAGEYIEYDVVVAANGVLERTGLVLDAGKQVVVYAGAVGLSVNLWGYEE